MYRVITNDLNYYVILFVKIAHIICNHSIFGGDVVHLPPSVEILNFGVASKSSERGAT